MSGIDRLALVLDVLVYSAVVLSLAIAALLLVGRG